MPPRDKKAAKARRDNVAEKLKQLASSVVHHQPATPNTAIDNNNNDDSAFASLAEDDAVSRRAEQRALTRIAGTLQQQHSSSNKNDDDDDDENIGNEQHQHAVAAIATAKKKAAEQQQYKSNKERKAATRPTVDALKASTRRPDLVHEADCTGPDPFFTVQLKQMRNTVPVPSHWEQKAAFMAHTVDRDANSAFESTIMPAWIANMNIASAWDGNSKPPDPLTLTRPFVAGHARPALTQYGELFFEGKDMRARIRGYKPGVLSDRLRDALGMARHDATVPPPWLSGMQRVGRLPPSYPNLKIPGVNAPIPSGASFGRGKNGWGNPPRDPNNESQFLFDGVMDRGDSSGKADQRRLSSLWGAGFDENMSMFTMRVDQDAAAAAASSSSTAAAPAVPVVRQPQSTTKPAAATTAQPTNVTVPMAQLIAAGIVKMPDAQATAAQQTQFAADMNMQQTNAGGVVGSLLSYQPQKK